MVSCSDDDDFSNVEVTNSELRNILKDNGYTFTEQGQLVQNDKVLNTTSLNLSGTKISDLSDLDVLPNLTEVDLSDNGYGPTFDFSVLPSTLTGVILEGNDIYEFTGLVNVVTAENGDETVTELQTLTKLYLPESAKYDCRQIVYFYEKNESEIEAGTVDMKIENSGGSLQAYTTLREVPDDNARSQLQAAFPSVFDGDNIDISKRITSATESVKMIYVQSEDVDGFQYILHNRGYSGTYCALVSSADEADEISYLKIDSTICKLALKNIDTPNGIDFSNAKSIAFVTMNGNPSITTIDFSYSELMGQRDNLATEFSVLDNGSYIDIEECPKLTTIKFPEKTNKLGYLTLINLPLLNSLDLSNLETMLSLSILKLPNCEISLLTPDYFVAGYEKNNEDGRMLFVIDEDIYNKTGTKNFLDNYHENLKRIPKYYNGVNISYDWTADYSDE